MKLILDTNIYTGYLLAGGKQRTVTELVDLCLQNAEIDLIVPQESLEELRRKGQGKPFLRTHIRQEDLDGLIDILHTVGTCPPSLQDVFSLSRDPKDDYLLTYGVVEEADYLVTGDDDLLALGAVDHLKIVSPAAFWKALKSG